MNVADLPRGVICPMVTPFDATGELDLPAVSRLIEFLLTGGVNGLMVAGTTGEGLLLQEDERKRLIEHVVTWVAGRVPVIAHVGAITTREVLTLTRHARAVGVTAVAVITPYFYSFDDEALFTHFMTTAEAALDLPIFLYTFPSNAKNDIGPELFARLLEAAPNIVGIKSSNPSLTRLQEYLAVAGERAVIFCGVDGLMLPALVMGAHGQVSGNANVFPELFRDLYAAWLQGDLERARKLQRLVDRVRLVLRDGISPVYFKEALKLRGVPAGHVRGPLRELPPETAQAVKEGLQALGLV